MLTVYIKDVFKKLEWDNTEFVVYVVYVLKHKYLCLKLVVNTKGIFQMIRTTQ